MMLSININDLLKLSNLNIIDIRSEQSYNNNHIKSAKNIPLEKLLSNVGNYLKKNETYYIYCQKGISSFKTCQILNKMGYKAINLDGGYEAWILKK